MPNADVPVVPRPATRALEPANPLRRAVITVGPQAVADVSVLLGV